MKGSSLSPSLPFHLHPSLTAPFSPSHLSSPLVFSLSLFTHMVHSLAATIYLERPDLLANLNAIPISLNAPKDYFPSMLTSPEFFIILHFGFTFRFCHLLVPLIYIYFNIKHTEMDVPGVGELMLASFPRDLDFDPTEIDHSWYVQFLLFFFLILLFFPFADFNLYISNVIQVDGREV